jgi:hypothetical protein
VGFLVPYLNRVICPGAVVGVQDQQVHVGLFAASRAIVTTSGEPLLNATGEARLNHGVTSIEVTTRFSSSRPGRFILQVRKAGSEWNSYSIFLR